MSEQDPVESGQVPMMQKLLDNPFLLLLPGGGIPRVTVPGVGHYGDRHRPRALKHKTTKRGSALCQACRLPPKNSGGTSLYTRYYCILVSI